MYTLRDYFETQELLTTKDIYINIRGKEFTLASCVFNTRKMHLIDKNIKTIVITVDEDYGKIRATVTLDL